MMAFLDINGSKMIVFLTHETAVSRATICTYIIYIYIYIYIYTCIYTCIYTYICIVKRDRSLF
eukprot:COSAG06_NODE_17698_length_926_cov_0.808948_1_plen_63_part_00